MALDTNIRRRGGCPYEYFRKTPDHLVAAYGRKWIVRSLKTKDPVEARRRAAMVAVQIDCELAALEVDQHENAAWAWFHKEFHPEPPDPRHPWNDPPRRPPIRSLADLKRRVGAVLGGSTSDDVHLLRACQSLYEDLCGEKIAGGEPGMPYPNSGIIARTNPEDALVPAPRVFTPLTMAALIAGWAKDVDPSEKTAETSWPGIMKKLAVFVRFDDATKLTPQHIVDWKEDLLKSKLARSTAANHLQVARTLFGWAVKNHKMASNVAQGISIKFKKKSLRRGYSDDEARRVLEASRTAQEAHLRWVPLLCAHTGCRLEEVCGAAVSDVRRIHGIWTLHIRLDNREAGLKLDERSERLIPLHSRIIQAGFIDYVRSLPKDGPLFPSLRPDAYGRRSGTGTKRIGRWIRKIVVDPKVQPNNAWRHRFRTLCRNAGIRQDVSDYLTSHGEGDVASRYGEYDVPMLRDAIERINSPVHPSTRTGGALHEVSEALAEREPAGKRRAVSTAGAASQCKRWLCGLMRNGVGPGKPKESYWNEARERFQGLSRRQFDHVWITAGEATGNRSWSRPGPRPKHLGLP
jgi:integrase